ncbi:hypothetical protein [Aliivibrio fischeri]|uniref:hypothetical protein n=1 Tax=Aliivibrio fischeri TaxID=668 RepID=UPI0012DA5D98|nr:hypothetical protein [Aliivibrio fischeri]MUL11841.1 hypothetical protein [Aliivibrio fischeri]MUL15527.1 hypothetical protein [Aliivibrio fischeri]
MKKNYKDICKSQLDAVISFLIFLFGYGVFVLSVRLFPDNYTANVLNYLLLTITVSVLYASYHNLRDKESKIYLRFIDRTASFTEHYHEKIDLFRQHTLQLNIAVWFVIILFPLGINFEHVYKFSSVMLPIIVSIIAARAVDEYRQYSELLKYHFFIAVIMFAVLIFGYTFYHSVDNNEKQEVGEYSAMFVYLIFCGFFGAYFVALVEMGISWLMTPSKSKSNT